MKRIVAISEHNTCECCGKTNLKRTFIIFDNESGSHVYYGSDCARRDLGKDKKIVAKELNEQVMKLQAEAYLRGEDLSLEDARALCGIDRFGNCLK